MCVGPTPVPPEAKRNRAKAYAEIYAGNPVSPSDLAAARLTEPDGAGLEGWTGNMSVSPDPDGVFRPPSVWVGPEIPVTPEMIEAGGRLTGDPLNVEDVYRAMRALEPHQFSPTDEDRHDLAVFLEAMFADCTYGEIARREVPDQAFARMADQIFEHAWYTPSVVEVRTAAREAQATLNHGLAVLRGQYADLRNALMRVNDGDSVADIHDRAQQVARDILAGSVTKDDRVVVQEALKKAPKDPTAPPMASGSLERKGDQRRVGWP